MKNFTKLNLFLAVTALLLISPKCYCQTAAFDIGLSGTVPNTGVELQVFGVLNVDPSMAFSAGNATGALFFQIDNEAPIALPQSGTGFLGNNETSLQWNLVGDDLFLGFNETSSLEDQIFSFDAVSSQGDNVSLFLNGVFDPSFSFGFVQVQLQSGSERVPFSASTEPGIRIGTLRAVPEPSGAVLIAIGSFLLMLRRRNGM